MSHPRFNQDISKSYRALPLTMGVKFGSGNIEGQAAEETIHLGALEVLHQGTGCILKENGTVFEVNNFEGVLGLSLPKLNTDKNNIV
eukprot:TRINITY_DN8005_c1_g1_i1.p2 TRINITY_DN8005_c1_g1~~TRINITY_DN8005_c1_g1_i1.p2  ORF type:complete len:102 (+),score=22.76 TRINITY_DN8005_c1_g1_i1:46-306(+)